MRFRTLLDTKAEENYSAYCPDGIVVKDGLPDGRATCMHSPDALAPSTMSQAEVLKSCAPTLVPEYDTEALRQLLREQLRAADREKRLDALSQLSQKSLHDLCQHEGLRTGIRVFRARYHLACLEEILAMESGFS